MAGFQELITDLRRAEAQLVRQLGGIRGAISSLEMSGEVSPAIRPGREASANGVAPVRKRRTMSAAARKAVGARMKRYWAQRRKAQAK